MKTGVPAARSGAATIVQLIEADPDAPAELAQLARARAFSEPLLAGELLDTGEEALAHADAVAAILEGIGAAPSMRAAAYLVYAGDYLNKPEEVVAKAFGASHASLVVNTRKLVQLQRAAREADWAIVTTDEGADGAAERPAWTPNAAVRTATAATLRPRRRR